MRSLPRLVWFVVLGVVPNGACAELNEQDVKVLVASISTFVPEPGRLEPPATPDALLCLTHELEETDNPDCTMTDADGLAFLLVPFDQEISYTLEKEGYGSLLFSEVIPASARGSILSTGMSTNESLKDAFERVGSNYPLVGEGAVIVFLLPPSGRAGGTFDLVDATGEPFYGDEEGNWSADLEATTSRGWGGFLEVPPGDQFQIKLGGTAQGCVLALGWPGDDENSVKFPVRAGHITAVQLTCPPPP